MAAHREFVHDGVAIAKALDYTFQGWVTVSRYIDDGAAFIVNNRVEQQIRPWVLGRDMRSLPSHFAKADVR